MPHLLPSYLHMLRKQWGLSQPELAALLDLTGSALCRFENRSRRPTAELIIGTEVIFGSTAKEVFPAFYRETERDILRRARVESDRLKSKGVSGEHARTRLLDAIIERAGQTTLGI